MTTIHLNCRVIKYAGVGRPAKLVVVVVGSATKVVVAVVAAKGAVAELGVAGAELVTVVVCPLGFSPRCILKHRYDFAFSFWLVFIKKYMALTV